MEYRQRLYPLFSACGLNCGLCPRYQTDGKSNCPGCSGKDFSIKHPKCGVLTCSLSRGYEYCYECEEYPCKKYIGADITDSFISHKNQFRDMEKAKESINDYRSELEEKITILEELLANYDDGRRKGFFCLAVNLLELSDIKHILKQIKDEIKPDTPKKENVTAVIQLFQSMAKERGVLLKLRKKSNT